MAKDILTYLGNDPTAFEGVIFCNPEGPLQYTFDEDGKCWCGNKLKFYRIVKHKNGSVEKLPTDQTYCKNPKCNKKWILLRRSTGATAESTGETREEADEEDDRVEAIK